MTLEVRGLIGIVVVVRKEGSGCIIASDFAVTHGRAKPELVKDVFRSPRKNLRYGARHETYIEFRHRLLEQVLLAPGLLLIRPGV